MMEIKEKGKYRLLKDISIRGSRSIAGVAAGTIFEVTQIDDRTHKIIGPDFIDWTHWELPAEKVEN